ncbi:MAG: peptidase M13 [Planctomycetia bacterium]|nr:peptidase M13 [Planctomycetia bacterium]
MLKIIITVTITLLLAVSCTNQVELSGVDKSNFDTSIRPQDDFFRYVNGTWLKETEMPADKSRYGSFTILYDENQIRLREIIEDAAAQENKTSGSDVQKVGDYYTSFIDSAKIEELGLQPLEEELNLIENVDSWDTLAALFAHHRIIGVQRPFTYWVDQDDKNSEEYILFFHQSGLGLPDRDYYFTEGEKFEDIRTKYVEYLTKILELANDKNANEIANKVMEMEMALAENQWTRVENRDSEKTYNRFETNKLSGLSPNFNWQLFFNKAGIAKAENIIVRQPSYFAAFSNVLSEFSIDDWKNYSKVKLISGFAAELSQDFVNASFDFYGKTLRGMEINQPRWKRAVRAVDGSLGEILGKVYVEKYFKPEAKDRMVNLVDNLKLSMKDRIGKLEWMSEETKLEALTKLNKFNAKIGYPNKWKDYSKLIVKPDELVLNTIRSAEVEYNRDIDKLGKPIDREEWGMTPQTVNAYYNPSMNEIVFPAAILQPPFFNMKANDAVNYGGIGAVIGHEITHGFDDQGRKYDGDGNMREWWTEEDGKRFDERAQVVVDQYSEFVPIDSLHINGELTLGENIADIGGLTVAYNAYQLSLNGEEPPVLNGFTGSQRVFLGWAQIWRMIARDEYLRNQVLTNPHSPGEYRVIGVMNNMPEFYKAFDVKEGDGHYLPESERVKIW